MADTFIDHGNLADNRVYQFLKGTLQGQAFLKAYEHDKRIEKEEILAEQLPNATPDNRSKRKRARKLFNRKDFSFYLIWNDVERRRNFNLGKERFEETAICLSEIFRDIPVTSWFIGSGKGTLADELSATGDLYKAYRSIRNFSLNVGQLVLEVKRRTTEAHPISAALERVKTAKQMSIQLFQDWSITLTERRQIYAKSDVNVIFTIFPIYLEEDGLDLAKRDFLVICPTYAEKFLLSWEASSRFVILHAKSLKNNARLQGFVQAIPNVDERGCQAIVALLCIPYMLGYYQCLTVTKNRDTGWKASPEEVLTSFMSRVRLYQRHGETLGAYLVACGPTQNIKCTYVVMGNNKVRIDGRDSPIKAVDLCFKCLVVLKASPCEAAALVWRFLESFGYGMDMSGSQSVKNLIFEIQNRRRIIEEFEQANPFRPRD
ncbi:hypothetical protein QAD02_020725 [Eretmocerus hayati]|uniref:Uncharacterized protein n=1 Tax=Eretmocerus hayati TaxID=131215 RepID=A0ACC2PNG8_9HYME|nr:hypothetical protein QAD02_020725 [Eretmocerus hayati]